MNWNSSLVSRSDPGRRPAPVVKVHVPLRRADIRVPQQAAGVFDSLFPAELRPTLVAGLVEHQTLWQPGQISLIRNMIQSVLAGALMRRGCTPSASRTQSLQNSQDLHLTPRFASPRSVALIVQLVGNR